MRGAEAQLQAFIESAGRYLRGTGTTPHHFLPGSSTSSSASYVMKPLPPPPPPPSSSGSTGFFGGANPTPHANTSETLGGEKNTSFSTSLVPRLVMGEGGGGSVAVDPLQDEMEKARVRQMKAALRRERNKAAARRSNLNRKIFRDQLEKKSLELWEENLQLQQDIRQLSNQLRHYCHVHRAIRHVCHASLTPPPPPPPPPYPMAECRG